jgi:hypothetical protein
MTALNAIMGKPGKTSTAKRQVAPLGGLAGLLLAVMNAARLRLCLSRPEPKATPGQMAMPCASPFGPWQALTCRGGQSASVLRQESGVDLLGNGEGVIITQELV